MNQLVILTLNQLVKIWFCFQFQTSYKLTYFCFFLTGFLVEVMDLLLSINNFGYSREENERVTMVMVTHNPDIECYADRILYLADGTIVKQVHNHH